MSILGETCAICQHTDGRKADIWYILIDETHVWQRNTMRVSVMEIQG